MTSEEYWIDPITIMNQGYPELPRDIDVNIQDGSATIDLSALPDVLGYVTQPIIFLLTIVIVLEIVGILALLLGTRMPR